MGYVDDDPMESAVRTHPLMTKYVGARILSAFTLIMAICCVGLVGVSIASMVLYRPTVSSQQGTYLVGGAAKTVASTVEKFLASGNNCKILVENGVPFSSVFQACDPVISVTIVGDSSSSDYTVVSRYLNTTDIRSEVYVGDDEDVRDSHWYQLGDSGSEYTWDGPFPFINGRTSTVSTYMDLIWKTNTSDSDSVEKFSITRMAIDTASLKLGSDLLLDNFGSERVWVINRFNRTIVAANNVSVESYVTVETSIHGAVILTAVPIVNVSSSLSDGVWLQQIRRTEFASNATLLIEGLKNEISAVIVPVNGTASLSVIVATNSSPFEDSIFSAMFLVTLILALVPLLATALVGMGYWLRVSAIKKRKLTRRMAMVEAQIAMEATRKGKLSEGVIEMVKPPNQGLGSMRSSFRRGSGGTNN